MIDRDQMDAMGEYTPDPGSAEAISKGCLCPMIDNHHGRGRPSLEGPVFIIAEGCPLHTIPAEGEV